MSPVKGKDIFSNRAYASVLEAGANTLTFGQIHFGTSVREKMAIIIHRITYKIAVASVNLIIANDDFIQMAVTRSEGIANLNLGQPAIIDRRDLNLYVDGTPASSHLYTTNFISSLEKLPGGGKLSPADPIYCAVFGASLANPVTVEFIIDFTWKALSPAEYWELVESMRMIL